MPQSADLASQVLRLEQQLEAYERLHTEELVELRRALHECKRAILALSDGCDDGLVTLQSLEEHQAPDEGR